MNKNNTVNVDARDKDKFMATSIRRIFIPPKLKGSYS